MDQQCQEEAEDQTGDHGDHRVDQGVQDRLADRRIRENGAVVVEPCPPPRGLRPDPDVEQAAHQRQQTRQQNEQADRNERRCGEGEPHYPAATLRHGHCSG